MQPVSPDDGSLDVIGAAKPTTVAKCHEVIDALARQVDVLRQRVVEQGEKLAVLQERLKLDSKNSSKPPSSDGPGSGNRAQRRASLRKRGAQPGHKGSCRVMLDESHVDRVIECRPVDVCECGAPVQALADEVPVEFRLPVGWLHAALDCCSTCLLIQFSKN